MRKIGTALLATALSLAMAPAFAQNDAAPRLTTSGHVMVARGGEYVSAVNGQSVMTGQSFMVESGSSATVTYPNNCTMSYVHPGTYVVQENCDPAAVAYVPGGRTLAGPAGLMTGDVAAIGIVAGVVALSAAGLHAMGDDSDPRPVPPPISP